MSELDDYLRARALLKGGPVLPLPRRSEDGAGGAEVGEGTTNILPIPPATPPEIALGVIYAEPLLVRVGALDVPVSTSSVEHHLKRAPATLDALNGDMVLSLDPVIGKDPVRWGRGGASDPRPGELDAQAAGETQFLVARKLVTFQVPVEVPLPPEPASTFTSRAFDVFVERPSQSPVKRGSMFLQSHVRPDEKVEYAEHWLLDPDYDPPGEEVVSGVPQGPRNVRVQGAPTQGLTLAQFMTGAASLPLGTRYAQVVYTFEPLSTSSL